jgi:hypothetical protein
LRQCHGASSLRSEMQEFFLSLASTHIVRDESAPSGSRMVKVWEFPDKYALPEHATEPSPSGNTRKYDGAFMKQELDKLHPKESVKNKTKDAKYTSIVGLLNNPNLYSSVKGVTPATLETLAYHCINTLNRVSGRWIVFSGADFDVDRS